MARQLVMKKAIVRILLRVAVLLIVGSLPAQAQRITATLEGQVSGSTGAVISGADITAVNTHTGFSRSTVSSDLGEYRISLLPVGQYRVSAQLPGFRPGVSTVTLQLAQTARLDFTLQVGGVTE